MSLSQQVKCVVAAIECEGKDAIQRRLGSTLMLKITDSAFWDVSHLVIEAADDDKYLLIWDNEANGFQPDVNFARVHVENFFLTCSVIAVNHAQTVKDTAERKRFNALHHFKDKLFRELAQEA
jgi:hypothetical protein